MKPLTPEQCEGILKLFAKGLSQKEIAAELGIQRNTLLARVHIFRKNYGCRTTAQMMYEFGKSQRIPAKK